MSLRCGCYDQGDDLVFGPIHTCSKAKDPCTCAFPFGARTCPEHARPPLDPPPLVPSWVFVVPAERPYETTLSDDCEPGDLG